MGWMNRENEDWLKPIADEFIKAYEDAVAAKRELDEIMDSLAGTMASYDLDEIRRGGYSIKVVLPDEENVHLKVSQLTAVDLHDDEESSDDE